MPRDDSLQHSGGLQALYRQRMGGAEQRCRAGEPFPAHRRVAVYRTRRRRDRRGDGRSFRQGRGPGMVRDGRPQARQPYAEDRRPAGRGHRALRLARDDRHRQAVAREYCQRPHGGRPAPLFRRRRARLRGPHAAGRQAHYEYGFPGAAGRRRHHGGVEFPAQHVRRQDRAGHRGRQHGGLQGAGADAAHDSGTGGADRRHPAGRCRQCRQRRGRAPPARRWSPIPTSARFR